MDHLTITPHISSSNAPSATPGQHDEVFQYLFAFQTQLTNKGGDISDDAFRNTWILLIWTKQPQ